MQPDLPRPLKLVICGGGSAAILLLQSLKQRAMRAVEVTILEPRSRLGAGVAYSTDCPTHLLNTRACNMSITDDPDDFVRWLKAERPRRVLNWTREDFAPRSYFGDYLQTRLAEIRTNSNLRVCWLHSAADSITPQGRRWEVIPAHGEPITADVVILATGNEPPRVLGRGLAPCLWRNWTVTERRRFLRHVRPFWDAHRHRLAPRVHGKIERAIANGQLKIVRGRIEVIEQHPTRDGLRVTVRHGHGTRYMDVARIVNCTGPEQNPGRASNPLLQGLISDDLARLDPLGLGLSVDSESRVITPNGFAHPSLFAVGSLTRGTRWEITAIPEMREQANAVVRRLLNDRVELAEASAEENNGLGGETGAPRVTIGPWAAGLQFQSRSVSR